MRWYFFGLFGLLVVFFWWFVWVVVLLAWVYCYLLFGCLLFLVSLWVLLFDYWFCVWLDYFIWVGLLLWFALGSLSVVLKLFCLFFGFLVWFIDVLFANFICGVLRLVWFAWNSMWVISIDYWFVLVNLRLFWLFWVVSVCMLLDFIDCFCLLITLHDCWAFSSCLGGFAFGLLLVLFALCCFDFRGCLVVYICLLLDTLVVKVFCCFDYCTCLIVFGCPLCGMSLLLSWVVVWIWLFNSLLCGIFMGLVALCCFYGVGLDIWLLTFAGLVYCCDCLLLWWVCCFVW